MALIEATMVKYGPDGRVHIGANVIMSPDLLCGVNSGHVHIGDFVVFGFGVKLLCGHHDYTRRNAARHKFPDEGFDIEIGRGVWIASGVTIIGPAHIGDHAVVAAGSLVLPHTEVPEGELWAGHPAKFKKKINFAE